MPSPATATASVNLRDLEPRRVCLIKPSSLGDVIHGTAVLSALRARWPRAHIAWVVNRGLAPLLDGLAELDELIPFDRKKAGSGPGGWWDTLRFFRSLKQARFDLTIDMQGLLRSGLMAGATGAPVRLGLTEAREGAGRFYTHAVQPPEGAVHAVERLMSLAWALGAPRQPARFLVATTQADAAWARATLGPRRGPRLVVNAGARWVTKRWPPARFAAVARRAAEQRGASIIAVGAPEDRPLVDELARALGPVPLLDLCGQTTLPRLAALASQADVFLSNDTGPLHLAVAAGARVVAVFTCTLPEKTGPYGPTTEVVRSQVWCAGSCVKTCSRLDCMSELDSSRVWQAVARQLDQCPPQSRQPAA